VDDPADGHLVPFRRIAEVHRQRSAKRDERLVLHELRVSRADRAGLVADEVGTGVPQSRELDERGPEASAVALVLLPLELFRSDDPIRHVPPERSLDRSHSWQLVGGL